VLVRLKASNVGLGERCYSRHVILQDTDVILTTVSKFLPPKQNKKKIRVEEK